MTPEDRRPRLQCLECAGQLQASRASGDWLECPSGHRVPVRRHVARFVDDERYTASFGFEWLRHATTQLATGDQPATELRLQASLDFPLRALEGKTVLDAGCGMGRFAEVCSRYGAEVIAVDMSAAVDAAQRNLADRHNVRVLQADLTRLPLAKDSFDLVICLGVLHHTPNPKASFMTLTEFVKPGGQLSITVYSAYNSIYVLNSKFWRRLTTRLPLPVLHALSYLSVPLYYLWTLPGLGYLLRCIALISLEKDWRWRVLDTFDWYSPRYMSWHTHAEVFGWFREAGFVDVVPLEPSISVIGRKPIVLADP